MATIQSSPENQAQARQPLRTATASAQLSSLEGQNESDADSATATTNATAAPVQFKPIALAAMAEPPKGPEPALGLTPITVLENVRSVFRNYSARFGGNAVGTNHEITRMLNGANPGATTFLQPEDGLQVNDRGELVDNWGTPFFFQQLSRTQIEIHSAGPDRKM